MVKTSLTSRATVSFIGERRSINTNWLLKSSVNGQVISNYSAMPYTLSTDGKRRFGGPAFFACGSFFLSGFFGDFVPNLRHFMRIYRGFWGILYG